MIPKDVATFQRFGDDLTSPIEKRYVGIEDRHAITLKALNECDTLAELRERLCPDADAIAINSVTDRHSGHRTRYVEGWYLKEKS